MYVPGKIQEYLQEYKNIQYSTSKIAMCDIQSKMIKYTKMQKNIIINIRNIHRLKPIQKYHTWQTFKKLEQESAKYGLWAKSCQRPIFIFYFVFIFYGLQAKNGYYILKGHFNKKDNNDYATETQCSL